MKEYLTEEKLGVILKKLYPNDAIIHDRMIPDSGIRNRADYVIVDRKIIVEFDGYLHYCNSKCIISDELKDMIYLKMGYRVIRIPYFVQLTEIINDLLFQCKTDYSDGYQHGFIDPKALLPCDFCELGIEKFKADLEQFSAITDSIVHSLHMKYLQLEDWRLVVPGSLKYLIDCPI